MNDKDNEKEQERTIPGFDVQARAVTNWGAWGKEQQAQQDFEKRREEWMRQEALHEADMTSEDPQVSDDAVNDEDRLTVIGAERQLIAREMAERGLERLDKWREKWKAAHEDLTLEKKLARAREALERSRDDLTKRQNDTKALRKDFSTLQALRETAEYNLSGFLVGDPEPFDISQLSIPLQKEVENRIAQNLSAGGEVNFEAADRMTAELMAVEAVRDRLERQLRQSAIGDVKTGESSQIQALEKKIEKQGDELLALMEERITQLKASLETSAQPQSSRAGAEGDPLENELKQAEEERRNEVRRQIEELYEANRNNREAREGIEDDLTTSKDKLREMSRAVDRLQQERATVEGSAPASLFEETELLKEQFDEWKEERTGLIDRIQDLQDIQQRRSEKIQRLDRLARQWIPSEQQEVLDLAAGDDGQEEDELDAQLEAREANAWNLQLQERKLQWSLAELNSWALGSQMDSARRDMVTSDSTAGSQQWLRKFEQLLDKSLDDMPVDKLPQLMELKADRDGVKEDEELLLNELGAAQEDDSPEPLTWTLQDERDEPERLDELEEAAARLLGEDDDFVKNFRRQRQEWRDALNSGDPSGQPSEPFLSPERLRDMRDAVQQTVSNELKRIKSEENRLRDREHGKISFERENLMAWFSPSRLRSNQRAWVASFVRKAEKQLRRQNLMGAEKEAEVLKIVHRDVGNSCAWMNRLHKEKRFPLLNEFWTQIGKDLPSLFQEARLDRELKSLQERRQNFQPEMREMERNAQRRQGNLGLALREFGRGQTPDGTPPLTWSLKDEVTDRERLDALETALEDLALREKLRELRGLRQQWRSELENGATPPEEAPPLSAQMEGWLADGVKLAQAFQWPQHLLDRATKINEALLELEKDQEKTLSKVSPSRLYRWRLEQVMQAQEYAKQEFPFNETEQEATTENRRKAFVHTYVRTHGVSAQQWLNGGVAIPVSAQQWALTYQQLPALERDIVEITKLEGRVDEWLEREELVAMYHQKVSPRPPARDPEVERSRLRDWAQVESNLTPQRRLKAEPLLKTLNEIEAGAEQWSELPEGAKEIEAGERQDRAEFRDQLRIVRTMAAHREYLDRKLTRIFGEMDAILSKPASRPAQAAEAAADRKELRRLEREAKSHIVEANFHVGRFKDRTVSFVRQFERLEALRSIRNEGAEPYVQARMEKGESDRSRLSDESDREIAQYAKSLGDIEELAEKRSQTRQSLLEKRMQAGEMRPQLRPLERTLREKMDDLRTQILVANERWQLFAQRENTIQTSAIKALNDKESASRLQIQWQATNALIKDKWGQRGEILKKLSELDKKITDEQRIDAQREFNERQRQAAQTELPKRPRAGSVIEQLSEAQVKEAVDKIIKKFGEEWADVKPELFAGSQLLDVHAVDYLGDSGEEKKAAIFIKEEKMSPRRGQPEGDVKRSAHVTALSLLDEQFIKDRLDKAILTGEKVASVLLNRHGQHKVAKR